MKITELDAYLQINGAKIKKKLNMNRKFIKVTILNLKITNKFEKIVNCDRDWVTVWIEPLWICMNRPRPK
jgi:hypothetical protein